MLLDHPALAHADLSSLQCVFYDGGDAIPADRLAEALDRMGLVLSPLYGQPEVMVIAAMEPGDRFATDRTLVVDHIGSAGKPVPLTTVGIMDTGGRLLPAGERGEVVARGPLVTAGYYEDPVRSAAAFRYGWYHTGDLGYLDGDGYLYIVERGHDLIATGRFNVYSAEVEQALLAHPAVQSCAIMAPPDATWGEGVTAVIQARPGFRLAERDVRALLRERLGKRAPARIEIWTGSRRPSLGGAIRHQIESRLLGASG
jgi:fatty-acyl-CoA synthase